MLAASATGAVVSLDPTDEVTSAGAGGSRGVATVIGRGQVAISVATPHLPPPPADVTSSISNETTAPVALAASTNQSVAPKAE